MIRKAEIKDLLCVTQMIKEVIAYLQKLGVDYFSQDPGELVTGIIEHVVLMLNDPDAVIFVDENDKGEIKGMIAGAVLRNPNFCLHKLVGEVRYLYPLAFSSVPLTDAFESWRIEKGATITSAYVFPENDVALKAYEKHGLKINRNYLTGNIQEH
jgi:hypothetical protein